MTYRVIIITYRKADMTPDEFKTYYEETHVPLVKSMTGPECPLLHTRQYIHRTETKDASVSLTEFHAKYPAVVLSGSQANFDYDAIAEMEFVDQAAFIAFSSILAQPENATKIAADCDNFLITEKMALAEVSARVETKI